MRAGLGQMVRLAKTVWNGERGITGLETAIVLIAFIVVAAVFAFAVLTTGLFSTEKAKQTALSGLESATNTLEPKAAIIAEESTETADLIDNIQFKMTNSAGADSVGLSPARTLVTYTDSSNFVNAVYTGTGNAIIPFFTADRPVLV